MIKQMLIQCMLSVSCCCVIVVAHCNHQPWPMAHVIKEAHAWEGSYCRTHFAIGLKDAGHRSQHLRKATYVGTEIILQKP
jgi:hypothetical protein